MFNNTLFALIVSLFLIKFVAVIFGFGYMIDFQSVFQTLIDYIHLFWSDIIFIFIVFLLFVITKSLKSKIFSTIFDILMAVIFVIFALDTILMLNIGQRLILDSVFGFLDRANIVAFREQIAIVAGIIIGSILGFKFLTDFISQKIFSDKNLSLITFFASFLLLFFLFALADSRNSNIDIDLYNQISIQTILPHFGNPTIATDLDSDTPSRPGYFVKQKGNGQKPNIILVFLESASVVDSSGFGGLADRMPKLDNIASSGIEMTNFMANGCSSDTAHIPALQGVEARNYGLFFGNNLYDKFTSLEDPLPIFMSKYGYSTYFLSTVTLKFLNEIGFIQKVGFQHIIDENSFDSKKPTYTFSALPDADLYDKAIETIQSHTGDDKIFLAMQTISTHEPYRTPYGKTESQARNYMDDSFDNFFKKLQNIGFFESGIIIVVGDHRKMQTIEKDEYERFGKQSASKVIAFVYGTGIQNQKSDYIFQDIDIYHSIRNLITNGYFKTRKYYNDIFTNHINRDRFVRYCNFKDKEYVILPATKNDKLSDNSYSDAKTYINSYIQRQYNSAMNGSILQTSGEPQDESGGLQNRYYHGLSGITLVGHGGSPTYENYNSVTGAILASKQGADMVELDISYTKDDVNVVVHGPSIPSPRCKNQNTLDYRLDYIQTLCPMYSGEVISTLDEFLLKTKDYVPKYIVEIKVDDPKLGIKQAKDAIRSVENMGLTDRVMFISYDPDARLFLATVSGINAARDTFEPSDIYTAKYTNHSYFMLPFYKVDNETVNLVNQSHKKFMTYTPKTTGELVDTYRKGVREFMVDDIPRAIRVFRSEITGYQITDTGDQTQTISGNDASNN